MAETELFIHAVQMVEVDGSWNIPTAVLYQPNGTILIGNSAIAEAEDTKLLNEDFKIDLGRYSPGVQSKRRFLTSTGTEKSAVQLADDFLYEVQKITKQWLLARGISECKNIVVAEPLSMHTEEVSPEWLANYRTTLRRILEGKTILTGSGTKVRFIPEPFAAFQYYRHGIRHNLVAQRTQMNALVIDFGGGTCDVCIIETTKEGDISGGGRNKRPLAGKSLPIGGFALNRSIAEALIRKVWTAGDASLRTGFREYRDWYEGRHSLDTLDARYKAFIENFHALVHRVEPLKLALSRSVTDWSLGADQRFTAPIAVVPDPFVNAMQRTTVTFSVAEFREVFVQKIYSPHIKPFLADRLKAGREVLQGAPITIVLLSGGSANIGWLRELIKLDFANYLPAAQFVQIPDYQQVVAHGLAVDCAREFSTGLSDFKGITYNPLYLLLDPDDSGCETRPFVTRTPELPDVRQRPGLLLPTASLMAGFVDRPMQWRVKLNRPPRRKLDYFFLQASMDPSDVTNLQNVDETTLHTPAGCEFDNALHVQLTIRPDGTAVPKFIYRAATPSAGEIAKEGRKFFVDMTDASVVGGEAYLGLDFGTSNTALSYVDRSWVQLIEKRNEDASWLEIGELVDLLPSPLSLPLARYVGEVQDTSPVPPGYSFIEAALCLAAYVSYIEFCSSERRGTTRILKEFPHRSASYLWHMLKTVQQQLGARASITKPFQRLTGDSQNHQLIDRITKGWADTRHEISLGERNELLTAVKLVANVCNAVFSGYTFGYFQGVQKERFSKLYNGRFRIAHGKQPHSLFLRYSGSSSFSEAEAMIVSAKQSEGLALTPLIFWYPCLNRPCLKTLPCRNVSE